MSLTRDRKRRRVIDEGEIEDTTSVTEPGPGPEKPVKGPIPAADQALLQEPKLSPHFSRLLMKQPHEDSSLKMNHEREDQSREGSDDTVKGDDNGEGEKNDDDEDGDDEDDGEEEEEEDAPAERLILLSIKTPGSPAPTVVRFVLGESIVRKIPEYARRLDNALASRRGHRLRISDNRIRREDTMIQAIEYLSYGILEPINPDDDPKTTLSTLHELVGLYDISISLTIAELEQAIVDHIYCSIDHIDMPTFISFAVECYKEGKEAHKATAASSLGQMIKKVLAKRLSTLIETGKIDHIKESGNAALNKQLLEVFTEDFVRKAKPKSGLKIEDGE